jgi:chromate reductase
MNQSKSVETGIIVGSLRKDSLSRLIANALIDVSPISLKLSFIEIKTLSMYNADLDDSPPKEWQEFRAQVKSQNAIIFVTPEYNRSVPGALKNAIDIGSRPYGASVFNAKPAGVISLSVGSLGGFGANHHLRQSLVYLNMPTMPQPEMYFAEAAKILETTDNLDRKLSEEFLKKFLNSFVIWSQKNREE